MSELSNKILKLRAEGKSFRQIESELGCSKSTISYHLSDGQRAKNASRTKTRRLENGLLRKVEQFQKATKKPKDRPGTTGLAKSNQNKVAQFQGKNTKFSEWKFTYQDVVAKFGNDPICYLTGATIDYSQPSTYHFDHIHPRSKGGDNSIENLGLATRNANNAKGDMSLEEFLDLCESVLKHHGRI